MTKLDLTRLHKRLKKVQRRFSSESPEAFGLHLLAVYKHGYNAGYRDGHSDGRSTEKWRALSEDLRRRSISCGRHEIRCQVTCESSER